MAFSKANQFNQHIFHQALWSKALAHPARIIILTYLLHNGLTPFYTLCKLLPLSATTVSQHLRALRINGLIEAKEKCPHTYYQIHKDNCKILASKIRNIHNEFAF